MDGSLSLALVTGSRSRTETRMGALYNEANVHFYH